MNRRGQGCGRGEGARKETVWEEGRGEKEGGGEEEVVRGRNRAEKVVG
jgi:hypothetical protein